MKFQDDISNMNTYIHTDKPKLICPHFFKVGGIISQHDQKRFLSEKSLKQVIIEITCLSKSSD